MCQAAVELDRVASHRPPAVHDAHHDAPRASRRHPGQTNPRTSCPLTPAHHHVIRRQQPLDRCSHLLSILTRAPSPPLPFFFFNDAATPEISPLPPPAALPI